MVSKDEYVALRKGWALGYLFRALEGPEEDRGRCLRYANLSMDEACVSLGIDEEDPELERLDELVQLASDGYL